MFPTVPGKCRCGCSGAITGRRRCWASSACNEAAKERFDIARGRTSAIRAAVHRRDAGVCAGCGMNCDLERARCTPGTFQAATPAERRILSRFMQAGFPSPALDRRPWWHADHVIPLAEGGANVLENFRTLCVPCHAAETRRLAGRLAAARRNQRHAFSRPFSRVKALVADLPQAPLA